ncbi:MAG: efflux RND transporter permease subunit [Prochloraceae cyanobacterium]|nr:efflux RND transporter permease subunit [Prochloraceae cyanobacterium]
MQSLFYRNSRLLLLTIILIIVWGISSFFTLPRLEDPELVSRSAIVRTVLPGADAERVEALVSEKIESEIADVEEIKTYESTSRSGISVINIELLETVTASQADLVWSRIRDKIDDARAELPAAASEPELDKVDPKAYAKIVALTWEKDSDPNYAILTRRAESLQEQLETLPGTEKVEIYGQPNEEITVEIDPVRLVALNLTVEQISRQIQQSDAKISAGEFRSANNNLGLEVESELNSLDRISNIPISFGSNGQFTKLGDLAEIKKGIKEPPDELATVDGQRAIALAVFVESNYRIDLWADNAAKTLKQFQQQLPAGLNLSTIFDQSKYVTNRLNELIFNLILGGLLVFGVTLLMMGWRSALIVSSALPLSLLMVLGWMKTIGIPLHQMSITGSIVALGLLIDTAIVVVDEVNNHLKAGIKPQEAIAKTVKYLSVPLLASTLTTVLAFMPIAILPGGAGEFVGTIGVVVILAVCSSLFLSLTVIPALAAIFRRSRVVKSKLITNVNNSQTNSNLKDIHSESLNWWENGISFPQLTSFYNKTLRWLFAKPAIGIFLALILPITGFVQAASLQSQFFPAGDRDQLQIELELPASASLEQTLAIANQARTLIMERKEAVNVHWFVGSNAPRFYYNLAAGKQGESNYAQAMVQLNTIAKDSFISSLQTEMDAAFPVARVLVRKLEQGPPFDAPVEMRIYGSDLDRLRILGEQARSILAQIPNVTHTRDSSSEILPQLTLRLDEEKANLAGLDNASISRQLQAYLEGTTGGSVLEETEELPVRVRIANRDRGDSSKISSLDLLPSSIPRDSIDSRSLGNIPLSSLGEINLTPENSVITRRNGKRYNLVQAFIAPGVLPSEILAQFQTGLKDANFELPSGYYIEFGGEAEESNNARGGLAGNLGVLLVLMVAVLVLSLSSFKLAGIIGIVGICSIGLGLFSLWLFGFPLGFMAIIGTIGLVGVAVNDSVVVLAALLENPAAKKGNRRAVRQVVLHSTRHVITTTLTTAIGFVPLLLQGGGFWPPLAIAIAGGICGATLLALYFVPCAYLLTLDRRSISARVAPVVAIEPISDRKDLIKSK